MKRLLFLILLMFTGVLAGFSQDYVTLYSDCNYRGKASKLYPGRYSLSSQNVGRNSVSSLRVPYGFKVVVYDADEPGQGNKTRYTSDMSCLSGDWNDRAASVVVERDGNNNSNNNNNNNNNNNYNGSSVRIFADCNFGGGSRSFGPGAYNTEQLAGVGNDKISSIQIPNGWQVIVYNDGNWQGSSKTYYATSNCLESGWNDRISSLRIYSNTNNNNWNNNNNNNNDYNNSDYASRNDGVTVFEDCYYGGRSYTLRPGRYDARQLGVGNDEISSMKVPSGFRITVYGDGGYSGGQRSFTRDVNCFGSDWNDKISSVEISRGTGNDYDYNHSSNYNNNELGVTFYEKTWFGGHSRTFGTGSFNFDGNDNLDRNASSIKVETGYTVTVFDEPGFRGNRRVFTGSSGNLNLDGWNDKIRSFTIRRNY
ncbi:MAG: hypothetical protein WBP58_00630 [Chitinophagaceae bacterium]